MAPIGELIPDGTFAKVRLHPPGRDQWCDPMDAGFLKASQSCDAKTFDREFTVIDGSHASRKFRQSFTVAGGKVDERASRSAGRSRSPPFGRWPAALAGCIRRTKAPLKAEAGAALLKHLDGQVFAARLMVESPPNRNTETRTASTTSFCPTSRGM